MVMWSSIRGVSPSCQVDDGGQDLLIGHWSGTDEGHTNQTHIYHGPARQVPAAYMPPSPPEKMRKLRDADANINQSHSVRPGESPRTRF